MSRRIKSSTEGHADSHADHATARDFSGRDRFGRILVFAMLSWLLVQAVALGLSLAGLSSQGYLYKTFAFFDLTGSDSWDAMGAAYDWLSAEQPTPVYQAIFFDHKIKFQYPLTSLLVYSLADEAGVDNTTRLFNAINWLCVLAQALLAGLIAHRLLKRYGSRVPPSWSLPTAVLAALVSITFFPVLRAYGLGQVQLWINTLFLSAAAFWLNGRFALSGMLVAAACMFKPQLGLFLVWAALRKNWAFVKGFVAVGVPAGVLSLLLFGVSENLDYLRVLRFISQRGEFFMANQSFNGLAHRWLTAGDSREWMSDSFAPYNAGVYYFTAALSAAVILWGLLLRRKSDPESWTSFLFAALAFTLASPIAWEHHFGFATIALVAIFIDAAMSEDPKRRTIRLAALFLAYCAIGQDLFVLSAKVLPINSLAVSFFLFAIMAVAVLLSTVQPGNKKARLP